MTSKAAGSATAERLRARRGRRDRSSSRPVVSGLQAELDRLAEDIARESEQILSRWQPLLVRRDFEAAAVNLANYLALRRRSLSKLQEDLSELGLSSLGRSEARVMESIAALRATLSRIDSTGALPYPPQGWTRRGHELLQHNTERIFGTDPTGPRTRIMVTLPSDAADDPELIANLISAGADCARINCAHDDEATWRKLIDRFRKASAEHGRDCRILMDLAGPKCRITSVSHEDLRVEEGDRVEILPTLAARARGGRKAIGIDWPEIVHLLRTDQAVSIDDGKIDLSVDEIHPEGAAARVVQVRSKRGRLRTGKGVNFPGLDLPMPALTDKDLGDLDFALAHADIIGYSFVQSPSDVARLQAEMSKRLGSAPLPALMLKIETRRAVDNLPELLVAAAGRQPTAVMIARGDLAVELGLGRLSELQEQILWLCEAAHVPVVWATQVLEGLVRKRSPTRAEASDAALSQRAECVMLNKGPHLVEAVRFLDEILHRMDRHVVKKSPILGPLPGWCGIDEAPGTPSTGSGRRRGRR